MRRLREKLQNFDELITTLDANQAKPPPTKKKHPNQVDTAIQNCTSICGIYVTTDNPTLKSTGINHVEGGWPRDGKSFS